MTTTERTGTGSAAVQGRIWGVRARDWAEIEDEGQRRLFEAVLQATNVGKGTRYLDVGCATGLAAALAAGRGAIVAGIDAAATHLAIARERVPDGDFRVADMQSLPFADESFDVVTAFSSLFFAESPVEAFREAGRVSRPGGTIAVAYWGTPDQVDATAYLSAIAPFLPPPPPEPPNPFAAPGDLEDLARKAGLRPTREFEIDCAWVYPDLETLQRGLLSAGPSTIAIEVAGEEAVRAAIARAVEKFRTPAGGFHLENTFRCLLATR